MIKNSAIIHVVFTLMLIFRDLLGGDLDLALCHAITSALLLLNFLGIVFIVHYLMTKKTIALPLVIIILKYPIIIAAIVYLYRQPWMSAGGVYTSVLTFLGSFFVAYFYMRARGQNAF